MIRGVKKKNLHPVLWRAPAKRGHTSRGGEGGGGVKRLHKFGFYVLSERSRWAERVKKGLKIDGVLKVSLLWSNSGESNT